jgi:polysaccharide biosynthesis protein PslH
VKLLIILSRVPYPIEKGDKLRAFHQLKYLAKNNDVILVCVNDIELHPKAKTVLNSICTEVHIVQLSKLEIILNLVKDWNSSKPLQVSYFYSKKAQRLIDLLIKSKRPDHIYCQLIRTTEYVKKHIHISKTLDYMDALSKGIERRINKANWFLKIILKLEFKRLYAYEKTIFPFFNNKTIISAR